VAGIAEAVKMGIVRDPALFEMLESWSPELVMSGFDEPAAQAREVLRRRSGPCSTSFGKIHTRIKPLNGWWTSGTTFSPALEGAMGFEIQHGEASRHRHGVVGDDREIAGLIAPEGCERILRVLRTASLPTFRAAARRSALPGGADRGFTPSRRGDESRGPRRDRSSGSFSSTAPTCGLRARARAGIPCRVCAGGVMKRTAIDRGQYRFEDCIFENVRAHGGERDISFARVLARNRGSIRFIDLSVLAPGAGHRLPYPPRRQR